MPYVYAPAHIWTKMLQKVWAITGTSTGLGREIALAALSGGDKVIATARFPEALQELRESHPENRHVLRLDVTDTFETLSVKAMKTVSAWGKIDVLVNNAGHSLFGTVEEAGVEGLKEMYKTNLFGAVNVTNAFLPYMRERRSGTVVFIGSRSGWCTNFPLNGLYGSSKAALHAIADALAEELRPSNIRVLNVVPGGLRTQSIQHARFIPRFSGAHSAENIGAYRSAEACLRVKQYVEATNRTQTGDPKRAGSVIVDVVRGEGVAGNRSWGGTFLGSDASRDVRQKCEGTLRNLDDWDEVTRSVNF